MPTKAAAVIAVFLLLVPAGNAAAQGTNPLVVSRAFLDAICAGEEAAAMAFVAEDGSVTTTRGGKLSGKEAVRRFVRGSIRERLCIIIADAQTSGERTFWINVVSADVYARLGASPVKVRVEALVQGGKIKSIINYFTPQTIVTIQRACDTPQGGSSQVFGLSCAEFAQRAKTYTEGVLASRKPFSGETNFMPLASYVQFLDH